MAFKLTFQEPIILSDELTMQVLVDVGVPVLVESIRDTGATSSSEQGPLPEAPKKRGPKPGPRKTNPAVEGETAAPECAATQIATAVPPVEPSPLELRSALFDRFTALVESDYDSAVGILTQFGVERFSALDTEQLVDFAAELGKFAAAS